MSAMIDYISWLNETYMNEGNPLKKKGLKQALDAALYFMEKQNGKSKEES